MASQRIVIKALGDDVEIVLPTGTVARIGENIKGAATRVRVTSIDPATVVATPAPAQRIGGGSIG